MQIELAYSDALEGKFLPIQITQHNSNHFLSEFTRVPKFVGLYSKVPVQR